MIIASEDMAHMAGDDEENPPSPSTIDIRNYMTTAGRSASIDEVHIINHFNNFGDQIQVWLCD